MGATTIKVINKLTGEVLEFEYSNPGELKNVYQEAKAAEDTIKRARVKIDTAMDDTLGELDELEVGDGYKFKRIQRSTKKYPRSVVAKYLDEDQMDLVTEVNGKKLKELLADLVKEGHAPQGAWPAIEAAADAKPSKPYVSVEKA